MSGRTCQLCGKPLSRFAVGSGGDFCSREHRNQFRLRLGMDRLQEANKVASLMRRRENAKLIPASQLAKDSKVAPRCAPPLRVVVQRTALHLPPPPAAEFETTRIAPFSTVARAPRICPASIRGAERTWEPETSFPVRRAPLTLGLRDPRLVASMGPSGPLARAASARALASQPREAPEIGFQLLRTQLGGNGIHVRPVAAHPERCAEPGKARKLNNSADRGRALRISGGIGFRIRGVQVKNPAFASPAAQLPAPKSDLHALKTASKPENPAPRSTAVTLPVREPRAPMPVGRDGTVELRWPGILKQRAGEPQATPAEKRLGAVSWTASAPLPPKRRAQDGAAQLRPMTTGMAEEPVMPRVMQPVRRLAAVRIQPRESVFQMPPTALYGSLSGGRFGAGPVRRVEVAQPTLEEHFDGGLGNWTGGAGDWKVDVAGVRPGSLALYSPSLEMQDYLLEFLARFDRGMTWMFRAADLTNYYRATLAAHDGGFEFRRTAVIGGREEEVTVRTVAALPAGKTAVTVRTRVTGAEYSVSIDGRVVDTWSDARLGAGGIGFEGAPEDRARLYWVKVAPAGRVSARSN